jgi:hypothetical protein
MHNGFIERFNRTYRAAILDMYIFESLEEVRRLTAAWIDFYNARRPHDSLGGTPPRPDYLKETSNVGIMTTPSRSPEKLKFNAALKRLGEANRRVRPDSLRSYY